MVSNSAYPKMVKFLGAGEKVENSNFIGLFCLKKPNLGGTELETRSQFSPKLFMALQCQNKKLLCQFFAQAIYLLAKTNLWNLKFWPFSPGSIKLAQYFLGWIGNQESVFAQTFHGPSVTQHETPATAFDWTNVPFTPKKPQKSEISWGELETRSQFYPKLSIWPFNVTRRNSYHSFCLNQCIF